MNINVTEKAREELKKVIAEKGTEKPLRIYLAGHGWGGPSFGIALDEQKDNDIVKEIDDMTFLIEEDFAEGFENFIVDYSDSSLKKGFSVVPSGFPENQ